MQQIYLRSIFLKKYLKPQATQQLNVKIILLQQGSKTLSSKSEQSYVTGAIKNFGPHFATFLYGRGFHHVLETSLHIIFKNLRSFLVIKVWRRASMVL